VPGGVGGKREGRGRAAAGDARGGPHCSTPCTYVRAKSHDLLTAYTAAAMLCVAQPGTFLSNPQASVPKAAVGQAVGCCDACNFRSRVRGAAALYLPHRGTTLETFWYPEVYNGPQAAALWPFQHPSPRRNYRVVNNPPAQHRSFVHGTCPQCVGLLRLPDKCEKPAAAVSHHAAVDRPLILRWYVPRPMPWQDLQTSQAPRGHLAARTDGDGHLKLAVPTRLSCDRRQSAMARRRLT
jgi:hypothetical protein